MMAPGYVESLDRQLERVTRPGVSLAAAFETDRSRAGGLLVVMPVFNGETFVLSAIDSALRSAQSVDDRIDMLVLDDCSTTPGWSARLRARCVELGISYHRWSRNVGIVANFNVAISVAVKLGYDAVLLLNSDVVVAQSSFAVLWAGAQTPGLGSLTSWSNEASCYSIPMTVEAAAITPGLVDWIGARLAAEFDSSQLPVPVGTGFAMLIPTSAIELVGLFDPVFGRGYCEETDWTLRCRRLGRSNQLALGSFIYHVGGASSRPAGLLDPGSTTIDSHALIIDNRYPEFEDECDAFIESPRLASARDRAVRTVVGAALSDSGFGSDVDYVPRGVRVEPGMVTIRFGDFDLSLALDRSTAAALDLHEAKDRLPSTSGV
jgi:GT2 family glycosyltransferase